MELRVLNAFLNAGVSWKTIRIASERARRILKATHPFSQKSFKTDGHTILLELANEFNDMVLLDLLNNQYEIEKILKSFFNNDELDFLENRPERWWPLGKQRSVVIDPSRSFGAPIVTRFGVPTTVLRKAFSVEQDIDSVAYWFDLSREAIEDALEFESHLAA